MKLTLSLSQKLFLLCFLLSIKSTYKVSCFAITPHANRPTPDYIKTSCGTTLYPKLCNETLSKFAAKIKANPKLLAMTALLVTLNTTKSTMKTLTNLSRNGVLRLGESAAVIECVEVVSDSVYELQKSMKELNHSRKGPEFELQMNDVQTWVSAALTDDDTCMDDFTTSGKVKILVRRSILRIASLTSIALAFINNYAAG